MPNLTFNAIDVETANRRRASICQIGLVQVHMGKAGRAMSFLVDPEENFEHTNTNIHGINESAIRGAITLPGIYPQLQSLMVQATLVRHSPFDKQAMEQAASKYGLPLPEIRWLDTGKIARMAWPEKYKKGGWGLKKIATDLGISFRHHEAGEDARVAAEILLHACYHTGLDVDDWLEQAGYNKSAKSQTPRRTECQGSQRNEAPEEASLSPHHLPQWNTILARILKLEEQRGFDNRSVLGGMDQFMLKWEEPIMREMGGSGIHRILLTIPYTSLTGDERSWWAEQWRGVIAGRTQEHPEQKIQEKAEPMLEPGSSPAPATEIPEANRVTPNSTEPTGWMRLLRNDMTRDGRIADWKKRQNIFCPGHPNRTPHTHAATRQLFCSASPTTHPDKNDAPGICGWRMQIPEEVWQER